MRVLLGAVCCIANKCAAWFHPDRWIQKTRYISLESGSSDGWSLEFCLLSWMGIQLSLVCRLNPSAQDLIVVTPTTIKYASTDVATRGFNGKLKKVMLAYSDKSRDATDISRLFNARLKSFSTSSGDMPLEFAHVVLAFNLPEDTDTITIVLEDLTELTFKDGDVVAW